MTKRFIQAVAVMFLVSMVTIPVADAGLINYERRNRNLQKKGGAGAGAGTYSRSRSGASGPSWMRSSPAVQNRLERRYDADRDGRLQADEVKRFLNDVINIVESRGGYTVSSDILQEYDTNQDGIISRYELSKLRSDAS